MALGRRSVRKKNKKTENVGEDPPSKRQRLSEKEIPQREDDETTESMSDELAGPGSVKARQEGAGTDSMRSRLGKIKMVKSGLHIAPKTTVELLRSYGVEFLPSSQTLKRAATHILDTGGSVGNLGRWQGALLHATERGLPIVVISSSGIVDINDFVDRLDKAEEVARKMTCVGVSQADLVYQYCETFDLGVGEADNEWAQRASKARILSMPTSKAAMSLKWKRGVVG